MLAALKKNHSLPRIDDGRTLRYFYRTSSLRVWYRYALLVVGMAVFTLLAAQRALDASTSRSGSTSDYLTWLLRSEEPNANTKPVLKTNVLASLPKDIIDHPLHATMTDTEHTASRAISPVYRAVVERARAGDTLGSVAQRYGVSLQASLDLMWAAHQVADARQTDGVVQMLQAGKLLKLTFDRKNNLTSLDYPLDDRRVLHISREGGGTFTAEVQQTAPDVATSGKKSSADTIRTIVNSNLKGDDPGAPPAIVHASSAPSPRPFFGDSEWQIRDTVRPGDFLASLLARHGVSAKTALQVAKSSKPVFDLARMMKTGNEVRLGIDQNGQLIGMSYAVDADNQLWIMRRDDSRFASHLQKKNFETRLQRVEGKISEDGSLFLAGQNAGISDSMVIELARLFEWDIDFARDIRAGDQFKVVYEVKYYEGHRERDGEIVAAEFINDGQVSQVFRYIDPSGEKGYYDAKGHNVRKMFIRAPVDFTRVSSLFSTHRKHPIYGYTRAHKGVDYAAPQGTPVRSAGDGRVTFVGNKGEYGKLILVRHNDTYTTAYAHLADFRRGLDVGKRVKQGEVIGQVGSTGSSTGPHLHYEVRVKDEPVNPLSAQLPTANPIPTKYAGDFRFHSKRMLAMLDSRTVQLAGLSTLRSAEKR